MVQQKLVSSEKTNEKENICRDEPELRFPEFNGKWKTVQINDLLEICYGKDFKHLNKGKYPVLGTGGVIDYVDGFLYSGESILIGRKGTIDKPRYINESFWTVDTLFYTKIYKGMPKFIFYQLNNINWLKYNEASGVPSLSANNVKKIRINLPSEKEQMKIANFLTKIDEKIELLEKKYEIKKLIKNYYLNKILIDDFQNNTQWDFKPLNEITFFQEGPGVRNYQYVSEGIKLLNVGNFVENKLILENTDRYISEEEAYGIYKHFLVDEGDLLIACSGIRAEYFDEKIAFAEKEHLPLCMNTSTMRFKSLDEKYINLNYLKWYFQTTLFKKQIFRVLTGSAQFNFGPTHLKYLKIIVPPLDYQIKISKFFDLIKKDLDNTKRQIGEMEKFKKALLQKMFV